jgi:phosphoribosyl-AMP cyclohydrolase
MVDNEESLVLAPKFDANGLITAVATDSITGAVLMVAHMNAQALAKTIETKQAWYWSRSRSKLWRKGETSGHMQTVLEMRVDCDQDAVWMIVQQIGPACHTNRKSCFYRKVELGGVGDAKLEI